MKIFVYNASDPCSNEGYAIVDILAHTAIDSISILKDHKKEKGRDDLDFNLVKIIELTEAKILDSNVEDISL